MLRLSFRFSVLSVLVLLHVSSATAQRINEIQSSNVSTIMDDLNGFPDWIELHNPASSPVSLNGYGLSDSPNSPFKWVFPNVSIPANGYLVVFASGENRDNPTQRLHTNFSVAAEGETVVLTAPNGTEVDRMPAAALYSGVSYGRTATGFGYFSQATPGTANTTTSYPGLTAPPVFSREGGMYLTSVSLSMSAEPGSVIYYTTDGSVPVPGVSPLYAGLLTFSSSQRVRARAVNGANLPSDVVTHTYARVSSTIPTWSSNLPIVVLMQHHLPITAGDKTPASMILIDREADGRAKLAGPATLHTRVDADIRGSSSQSFPQKMYGVELRTEWNGNRDEALLGMPADHNWILYAPYGEKTLMRNVLAYELSTRMGYWAPRTRFVEVFLHSGTGSVSQSHYVGVYVLVERVKWGEHRVNITPLTPMDTSEPEITGGYIIRKDRLNVGESGFRPTTGHQMGYYRPEESELTTSQKSYIRNYINQFESALYGSSYRDPDVGYATFIDTDSFIDHFLITEYLKEIDGYRLSTFLHKNRGGKLAMGPVWDFNISAGNANYVNGDSPYGWYHEDLRNVCVIDCGIRNWYTRLLTDPTYVEKMRYRWWELRRGPFSAGAINAMIDANAQEVAEAQVRHYQKWPILGQYVWPNQPGYWMLTTYQAEVDWMRTWLMNRMTWMDAQMGSAPETTVRQLNRYWQFNQSVANNTPLTRINATYPEASGAHIEFKSALAGYPFTSAHPNWRKASMERRNDPTSLNAFSVATGTTYGLQIKQPFRGDAGENELIFNLPTQGSSGVRFAFAVKDEGAAERLIIDYSITAGEPVWTTSKLSRSVFPLSEEYQRIMVDFLFIPEVNNNPNFKIRIRFDGRDMSIDNGNRVTFNNVSFEAASMTVGVDDGNAQAPERFELEQNVPNPFNPVSVIGFRLSVFSKTRLTVYDAIGRQVAVLIDSELPAGRHSVRFDGTRLASGVYIYRLESGGKVEMRKMVLIK